MPEGTRLRILKRVTTPYISILTPIGGRCVQFHTQMREFLNLPLKNNLQFPGDWNEPEQAWFGTVGRLRKLLNLQK